MKEQLEKIRQEALDALSKASDTNELDALRVRFLGKKGELTGVLKSMGKLSAEERPVMGQAANNVRAAIEEKLEEAKTALKAKAMEAKLEAEAIDVTIPGDPVQLGHRHPMNKALDEAKDLFISMGFRVLDGPEVELADYNFTRLNIAENHPSRDRSDTFYITEDEKVLLRTQTSPMQIRVMEQQKPPIRMLAPGRVFRKDEADATHSPMFHQVEGLWLGENISFADLKGVYSMFLRRFFETDDLIVRFRPSYFPFTEPSVEVDMMFTTGSRKGKWLEISGAGEVHPTVVRNYGLDPEQYCGFAFGSGLERLTMLRYGIDDLRLFFEGDLRFLRQFNE